MLYIIVLGKWYVKELNLLVLFCPLRWGNACLKVELWALSRILSLWHEFSGFSSNTFINHPISVLDRANHFSPFRLKLDLDSSSCPGLIIWLINELGLDGNDLLLWCGYSVDIVSWWFFCCSFSVFHWQATIMGPVSIQINFRINSLCNSLILIPLFSFSTEWQSLSGWSIFLDNSFPNRLPLQTT